MPTPSLSDWLWRFQPELPEKGTWTKLGPCSDFHVVATSGLGVLQRLWAAAFSHLQGQLVNPPGEDVEGADPAYVQEVAWHRVAGDRSAVAERTLGDDGNGVRIVCLALALEPLRCLTSCFMRRSSASFRTRRPTNNIPPVCSTVSDEFSPTVLVMTYMSWLMYGLAPRLILVWCRTHRTFDDWCKACPRTAAYLQAARLCRGLLGLVP